MSHVRGDKYERLVSEQEAMRQRDRETHGAPKSHHVEIGADLDSSGQVPHNAIPIMPRREKDSWIKGVWLQNKHLILVTLSLNTMNM